MESMQEREWRRLVETIRRGNCVLVLGADVVVDSDAADAVPLSNRLAARLSESLPQMPADHYDLPLVAQAYMQQTDHDRYDLELDTVDFYKSFADATTEFHRNLAALPFSLCLTASPDSYLAEAFRQVGKVPVETCYDFSAPGRRSQLAPGEIQRPIVYGLFGSVSHPPSMVLAETELLDFLVNVVRGTTGLPDYIAAQVADPNTAFLFVGFGFQRWYTRILLHVLQAHRHATRSLAVEGEAFFSHPDHDGATLYFEQTCSIVFRQQHWQAFAAELRARFGDVPRGADDAVDTDEVQGAPRVFLCHDSRDRERVAALAARLRELGIDTWRDRDDLRGGDAWDRQIRHVVRQQVDYVLVCETPNLSTKGESYLHLEVRQALERQSWFPPGQRFVVPVTLESCRGLAALDDLHRADLTDDSGIREFAADLLEDWQARAASSRGAA